MLRSFKNKKGQALVEYALVIAFIGLAAILAMQAMDDKYEEGILTTGEAIDEKGAELVTALTPD